MLSVILQSDRSARLLGKVATRREAEAFGVLVSNNLIHHFPYDNAAGARGLQIVIKEGRNTTPATSAKMKATMAQAMAVLQRINVPAGSGGKPPRQPRQPRQSAPREGETGDATAYAFVINLDVSPAAQVNVQLGSYSTLEKAKAKAASVGKALADAARAGGWLGGKSQVRMMAAHQGSHTVETIKVDANKALAWLTAHGHNRSEGGAQRASGRPKAPKPAAAPRPAPARAARPAPPPVGEKGYYLWLEAKEPGKDTVRKPLTGHRLQREAERALRQKLEAIMEAPNRVPRKGRKIRFVVKNERNKLIAVIPWIAA